MRWFALLFASLAFAGTAAAEDAQPKPTAERTGSLDDLSLLEGAPKVIGNADEFDKLATKWKLADKPKLDFAKEVVVINTTRGGRLSVNFTLSGGDLKVIAIATKDLRPGFRYHIAALSRDGVKTVNGDPLPK